MKKQRNRVSGLVPISILTTRCALVYPTQKAACTVFSKVQAAFSCRCVFLPGCDVRSEMGKPRGRIQGWYPNEERRISDPIP